MSFRILYKHRLTPDTTLMRVEAPMVARAARPGQFVIVRVGEQGERVPLTIADFSADEGWVAIVTQTVGATTMRLNSLEAGDSLADFVGPLFKINEDVSDRRFLFVAGGVGAAPVYPQARWLHERGAKVDVIIGARSRDLIIFEREMRAVADEVYLATDDGSAGLVTGLLSDLVRVRGKVYDEVVTIGPMVMMKFVAKETLGLGLKTVASLNSLMVDGTGMCGACRVTVGGQTVFACVDGPEFDAHVVDFDEAIRRSTMYRPQEERAYHKCKIGLNGE